MADPAGAPGRLWLWFAAGGLLAIPAYYLLSSSPLSQDVLFVSIGTSVVPAILIGVRANRPHQARPWLVLATAATLMSLANLVWYLYPPAFHTPLGSPSVADGLDLAGYGLLIAGMAMLIRARTRASDNGFLDTTILTVSLGVLSWAFLIGPYVQKSSLPFGVHLVSAAYPLVDILLVGLLVRLVLTPGARGAAFWLLSAYLVCQLLADTGYALELQRGVPFGSGIFTGWLASYAFLGAAALHPSMRKLSEVASVPTMTPTRGRLLALAFAALLPMTVLGVENATERHFDELLVVGLSAVMFLLVLARARTLVVDIAELRRAEEELQRTAAQLAEAQQVAGVGSWEWDVKANAMAWSQELHRLLGTSPDSIAPTFEAFLDAIHPDDRQMVAGHVDRAIRTGTPIDHDIRLIRADGEVRFIHIQAIVEADEIGTPVRMLGTVQDVTDRTALEEKIVHQALYDPLTDLANRALFADRLELALAGAPRYGRRVVVLVMDLNGFKAVNDTLGHSVGDQLLIEVAARTRPCIRPSDTVARLGGDEFAILLEDAGIEEAVGVAERILERFREPFEIEGRELFIDGSIGIAESPSGSVSAEALLRDADAAMYTAKRSGKGAYEVFQPEFHVKVLRRFELSTDLRRAVEHGEFVLHYQPIVTLKEGTMTGVEALIRWVRSDGQMVSPADFIPVAEQTGLIVPIDRWVMNEACRQTIAWERQVPGGGAISISVNISVRQLNDARLTKDVQETLQEVGLDSSRLTLEITESVLMQDAEGTLRVLQELKTLGVRLAIDDFGTGFSSLNYLRRLPVDVVKIDRSFVAGIASQSSEWTLARGIIRLVHELGLETVAEGVERADQRAHLQALGCRLAQGFFFARPMEPDAIAALLAKASSRSA